MNRRACLLTLAGACSAMAARAAPSAVEQGRIDRLIAAIEQRSDLRFVRNGSEHTGRDAARFLREKLKSRGAAVQTAQDFIMQIASTSSSSGQPYRIRLGDGRLMDSADFLRDELARIDAAQSPR